MELAFITTGNRFAVLLFGLSTRKSRERYAPETEEASISVVLVIKRPDEGSYLLFINRGIP
jgi:hypothetical protein